MKNITIAIKDGKAVILDDDYMGQQSVACSDKAWVLNPNTGEIICIKDRTGDGVTLMNKCMFRVFEDIEGDLRLLDENFSEMDEVNIEILLEAARARAGDRVEVTLRVLEEEER